MDSETKLCVYCLGLVLIGLLICLSLICLADWRRRSHAAAERLLDSVPDVPYLPLLPDQPDQQQASNSSSSSSSTSPSCVICMAEYARGEGRFVMPGCVHAFHRRCIAEWLRQGNTTCPICRGSVVAGVGVSTAEDMV